jgi:ATP-binding cassette subfamily F protein 3
MLEDALADYPGTLVLISHDRHFINSLCGSVGVIEEGRLEIFPGTYDDYQSLWRKGEAQTPGRPTPGPGLAPESGSVDAAAGPRPEGGRKEARQREAQARREQAARRRPFQDRVNAAEARLAEIAERKDALSALLADPTTYQDGERAKELNREFAALNDEAAAVERDWEEAMRILEDQG